MIVKIRKNANKKMLYNVSQLISSVNWSGSKTQASRKLELSLAYSPFDENFEGFTPELGDIVYFYPDGEKKAVFTGKIIRIGQEAAPGEITVSANDFMTTPLKSNVSLRFKNKTAEYISKYILQSLGCEVGTLVKTGVKLPKMIFDGANAYDAIIQSYRKAARKTKKKYMPYMDSIKFCVGESGKDSGITLKLKTNVISSSFEQSAEDIINKVIVFDEDGKRIGTFREKESEKNFGTIQETVTLSSGETAAQAARGTLKAPTKEVKVEALGNIDCISGRMVRLYDSMTGLTGKFFIENDTHTFANGTHTMSLDLAFQNIMEGDEDPRGRPEVSENATCWYSTSSNCYHAKKSCGRMNNPIKSTVREAAKTGRRKCANCWE